jgi:hypothetical protein
MLRHEPNDSPITRLQFCTILRGMLLSQLGNSLDRSLNRTLGDGSATFNLENWTIFSCGHTEIYFSKSALSLEECSEQGRRRASDADLNLRNTRDPLTPYPVRPLPPSMMKWSTRLCISAAPAALDRFPGGFTGHVAHPSRSIRRGIR